MVQILSAVYVCMYGPLPKRTSIGPTIIYKHHTSRVTEHMYMRKNEHKTPPPPSHVFCMVNSTGCNRFALSHMRSPCGLVTSGVMGHVSTCSLVHRCSVDLQQAVHGNLYCIHARSCLLTCYQGPDCHQYCLPFPISM